MLHGREGEHLWFHRRHMWPVSPPSTSSSVAASPSFNSITPDSFSKDGRKIHVGDCALFKPPQDSPPFVGIIRRLIVGKDDNLSLGVNWLYRPADINLGKDILLEAAPNEVFYSFHKDEIPAGSLLHPCKVSFLRKGVELPSGISSFVCRRVYDTEKPRLWWLTDRDYINERQEEVDQLLDKTRLEMYGALQSGGRSPKPLNGPNGTSQLKPGSDSVQNSSSSFPSQTKGKKREQGAHGPDSVKRERLSRADDADSGQFRPEHVLKSEIAKITDKGGLVDFEGVEKLVQLMRPDSAEKKIDLACRIMLVDVISVTDRFDCLGRFVQLRGLPVLDDWLQEVHKGKIGDGSPKESDKSVEEFLFALLRALDRLPVNLHALQTCNVGKSVNHLRSHKNSEIQKKARTLVDTWKKRVEAEMNIIDAKSGSSRGGSWPAKSVISEVSQVGSRRVGGSPEVGTKSSNIQPSAAKPQQAKLSSGEAVARSLASPGSTKVSALSNTPGVTGTKDSVNVTGAGSSDLPLSTIKEEKSSSSSQSHNNSQSCSSDHGKAGASGREDARSSTAGSVSVKVSTGVSRSRKSSNGIHASAVSGVQKEVSIGKFSSLNRNLAAEKGSPTRAAPERVADVPLVDNGSGQRLIVRLPNTGRSPARSASGGSPEDASASVGKASPMAHSEKHDQHDRRVRGKVDPPRGNVATNINMDSCHGKDGLVGTDGVNVSSGGALCEERRGDTEIGEKLADASKVTVSASASGVTVNPGKSYEASFSSINALVESCAKFSEASASASIGDDIGMNLLASVAAGEMSRSEASPIGSPERKSPLPEDSCSGNDVRLRQTDEDGARSEDRLNVIDGDAMVEQGSVADSLRGKAVLDNQVMPPVTNFSGDSKVTSLGVEEKTGECSAQVDSSSVDLLQNGCAVPMASDMKPPGFFQDASAAVSSLDAASGCKDIGEVAEQVHERRKSSAIRTRSYNVPSSKLKTRCLPSEEEKNAGCADARTMENNAGVPDVTVSAKAEVQGNDESASWSSSEMHDDDKKELHKLSSSTLLVQKPSHTVRGKSEDDSLPTINNDVDLDPKTEKAEDMQAGNQLEQSEKRNMDSYSSVLEHNGEHGKGNPEKIEVLTHHPAGTAHNSPASLAPEVRQCVKSNEGVEVDPAEDPSSRLKSSSASTSGSDTAVRLDFDLNEVLPVDDGSQGEIDKSLVPGNSSFVPMRCPLPMSVSSLSGSLPASITVASAAKGPFLPSESLLRSKVELGWKGSAATSAFRPAEPRKVVEVPVTTADVPVSEKLTSKQARPFLDFDLNVGAVEDTAPQNIVPLSRSERGPCDRSSGGLNLDLNACDDSPEIGQLSASNGSRFGIPQLPPRTLLSGGLSNSEPSTSRDFDLNNGPVPDETGSESIPLPKNGLPFMSQVSGVRMNNMELGNFSSWFSPGNTYSTIPVPPILPGRGDQSYPIVPAATSQRLLAPTAAGTSFGPDVYRGPVLSSSPAVAFPSASPFQYSGFPFDTNFPLPSNSFSGVSTSYVESSSGGPICFPPIPSQLVGPSGVVPTPYRPYVMSLPGGANNVVPDSRKWGSQVLDLNAGPGGTELERREERMPSTLRQLPLTGSQALAEEQLKMFQQMAAGGVLKRKEPDGGWDGDRLSYKHPSWQ